jgi:para-aminobenzoate synthetase component 1
LILPAFEELKRKSSGYPYVPLAVRLPWPEHLDPFHLMTHLKPSLEGAVLLESGRAGRYTFLAGDPIAWVTSKNRVTAIRYADGREECVNGENPLHVLRRLLQKYRMPRFSGLPDFCGGAVGYLSYDMNRYFEPTLPDRAKDDLQLPDLYVMIVQDVIAFDHLTRELYCLTQIPVAELSEAAYRQAAERLATRAERLLTFVSPQEQTDWDALRRRPLASAAAAEVSFAREEFEQAVRRVQAYIAQGDVFQVNLSVRQSRRMQVAPVEVYSVLRRLNPSPYMGYLHFPEFQLVSGSPELLIKVKDGEVSTRPIAGTRPRGRGEAEDERLARELIGNEKERAEHVMLVDLERNDLGRVCRYGSVEVSEFMVVEKYSHVMHIVSHVRGMLADGKDAFDAVAAAFPGGTITGAPKVRTMEIIEELEPVKRGVYTGSIGWFGFDGDLEINIAIRTLVAKDGVAHVQAGAGIVIDSIPEAEYFESLKKAEALWKALELSEERRKSREETSV